MVRVMRSYTIDNEFVTKLKDEGNASQLINDLLFNYFNRENSKDIRALQNKLDLYDNKLDEIRRKRDRLADTIREIHGRAQDNEDAIKLQKEEIELQKKIKKNITLLVKTKEISFDDYMIFKNNPHFEKQATLLFNKSMDLEEFLQLQKEFIKEVNKKDENEP